MSTQIFGIKTIKESPKARIELYLCGDIPAKDFSAEEVIFMLNEYIKGSAVYKGKTDQEVFDILKEKYGGKMSMREFGKIQRHEKS